MKNRIGKFNWCAENKPSGYQSITQKQARLSVPEWEK
jgi:hypothetical protein